MRILVLLLLLLSLSFSSYGSDLPFQEKIGEYEFSGQMIVRPNQDSFNQVQAAARLDAWRIDYQPVTDEHIVKVPEGYDENSFAEMLLATGDYEYVEPDWICFPIATTPNDPLYNSQWHHPKMKAPQAWDLYTGNSSFVAAVVDTGVDKDHQDLMSHLVPGYNSEDKVPETSGGNVNDVNGHGTATIGCVGAIGNNGKGLAGVNWSIKLMPIRCTNSSSGGANMSALTGGAIWAAQNGAKTISVSYSGVTSSSVGSTGTSIKNMGALLIWAAGNDGSLLSSGDWKDVIVAGASDQGDNPASFTNYGALIDVMAPGVDVYTTKNGGGYGGVSGTSFSAPLANGAAALIWGYNPSLTANEVEQYLFDGCDPWPNPSYYGHGRINLFESLKLAVPPLTMTLTGSPATGVLPPGPKETFTLEIINGTQTYVPGSGKVFYRFNGTGGYSSAGVTSLGGNLYEAVLPATTPGDTLEYYFSAQHSGGATITLPNNAPTSVYSFEAAFSSVVFEDDFETHKGWTVDNTSISTGEFERADPASTDAQPGNDHTPTGTHCYVTGKAGGSIGNDDLDGGPTRLISPTLDLSQGDEGIVSFYVWFYHSTNGTFEPLKIQVSNNNGASWKLVENLSHNPSWSLYTFKVSDYVTLTDKVKVRISAEDNPNDSVVEALVDDFQLISYDASSTLWADAYHLADNAQAKVTFSMDAGATYANRGYLLLGSVTGTSPGTPLGGITAPINWDIFTDLILKTLGTPIFQNFMGNLDAQGQGTATFDSLVPVSGVAGINMYFAYILSTPQGVWDYASNAIQISFDL